MRAFHSPVYSACLLEKTKRNEFVPTLEALLKNSAFDSPNVLVRDSVRLLGRLIGTACNSKEIENLLDSYPSKVPLPEQWPVLQEAQPLMELDGLPLNMKLLEHGIPPDFWRYQVQPKIHDFDLQSAGITHENLACWVMVETLGLGYPGIDDCALNTDRAISAEFGTGRSHKEYAERLGKKYYWLLLHRLIGILSDNVAPHNPYSDKLPGPEHLYSLNVRKVDLTDIRDITPAFEYPDEVLQGSRYEFPINAENIQAWIRTNDLTPYEDCIVRLSDDGDEWVALTLSANDNDRASVGYIGQKPYLQVRLSYESMFFCDSTNAADYLSRHETVTLVNERESYYRAYLAEYPDSSVFNQLAETEGSEREADAPKSTEVILLRGGNWEYDFSYTYLERQEDFCVPSQDLVNVLKLHWDRQRGWIDSNGKLVVFEMGAERRRGLFILRSALNRYLNITGQQLVYRYFANRLFYTGNASESPQIDLSTILRYQPKGDAIVLMSDSRLFSCEDGCELQDLRTIFPFESDGE